MPGFLVATAVRHVADPAGAAEQPVDVTDLIASVVREHPWGREVTSALDVLLAAACRRQAASGTRRPPTGRGEGDAEPAEALMLAARTDSDSPSAGRPAESPGTRATNRSMTKPTSSAGGNSSALLWAGFRVLATLSKGTVEHWLPFCSCSAASASGVVPRLDQLLP